MGLVFLVGLIACKQPVGEDTGTDSEAPANKVLRVFDWDHTFSATFCFTLDGRPECWAEDFYGKDELVPGHYRDERVKHMAFASVRADFDAVWTGVTEDGALINSEGEWVGGIDVYYPEAGDPGSDVEFVNVTSWVTCVLTAGGFVECPEYSWQAGTAPVSFPAASGLMVGPYREACALDAGDQMVCPSHAESTETYVDPWAPPSGIQQAVSINHGYCALSQDSEFFCWHTTGDWQMMDEPLSDREYVRVLGVGSAFACVQSADGEVQCFDTTPATGMELVWESSEPFPLLSDGFTTQGFRYSGDWVLCGIEQVSGLPQCWDEDLNERFDW